MLERIPGWTWELTEVGIVLVPPDRALGAIFYTERVRPLRPIAEIVDGVARLLPSAAPFQITATQPTITDEGEHAVIATLTDDGGLVRTVGVVFGDDFYALCVGVPRSPAGSAMLAEQVRACVARDAHMLGVRRRRFVYDPPASWQGLLTGPFHAVWYPLDFPRNPARLAVYPAIPLPAVDSPATTLLAGIVASLDGQITSFPPPVEVTTGRGLAGTWASLVVELAHGPPQCHELIVLQDDRYAYTVLLQLPTEQRDDAAGLLRPLIDSIQPVPRGGRDGGERGAPGFAWLAE